MADIKKKIEERVTAREALCKSIQNDITALATKITKLSTHDLETYQMLEKPDSLFYDCPISPFWTIHWIKQFMIKKDLDFIGHALDGKEVIKPFLEKAQEASGWILKFAVEKKAEKTGAEAIL